jgi:hypothetical protein
MLTRHARSRSAVRLVGFGFDRMNFLKAGILSRLLQGMPNLVALFVDRRDRQTGRHA